MNSVAKSVSTLIILVFAHAAPASEKADSAQIDTYNFYEEVFWDQTFSQQSSASIITYPYHYISRALDNHSTKLSGGTSTGGQLKRFLQFSLIEVPMFSFGAVLQHELSHGFRMREMHCEPTYHFGLPPPYSFLNRNQRILGEATDVDCRFMDRQLVALGGHEGNDVLADYLKQTSFTNETFARPISNLYVINRLELITYGVRKPSQKIEGVLQQKDVRSKALLNFIDPLIFAAVLQNIDFIRTGEIKDVEDVFNYSPIYPFLSYRLVPYGESFEAGMVAKAMDHLWELNISKWDFNTYFSDHEKRDGFHISFTVDSFLKKLAGSNFGYRVSLQTANEPYFKTGSWDEYSWVYGCQVALRLQPTPSGVGYFAGIDVKNRGYLPSKYLAPGSNAMIGLVLNQM